MAAGLSSTMRYLGGNRGHRRPGRRSRAGVGQVTLGQHQAIMGFYATAVLLSLASAWFLPTAADRHP